MEQLKDLLYGIETFLTNKEYERKYPQVIDTIKNTGRYVLALKRAEFLREFKKETLKEDIIGIATNRSAGLPFLNVSSDGLAEVINEEQCKVDLMLADFESILEAVVCPSEPILPTKAVEEDIPPVKVDLAEDIKLEDVPYAKVDSSNINKIGYISTGNIDGVHVGSLFVEFSAGNQYRYDEVPVDVYNELANAPSKGRYLANAIKGNYTATKVK